MSLPWQVSEHSFFDMEHIYLSDQPHNLIFCEWLVLIELVIFYVRPYVDCRDIRMSTADSIAGTSSIVLVNEAI
jgi:hypothetical protein